MGGSGSGSGGSFTQERIKDLQRELQATRDENLHAQFGTQLNARLKDLLSEIGARDTAAVNRRIADLLHQLGRSVEGQVIPRFGGSVAKHTFVDGISDVDLLFLIDRTSLAQGTPQEAVNAIIAAVQNRLGKTVEVDRGKISVRIRYPDGMELQVLPALKSADGLKVPSWTKDRWSEIEPKGFAKALSKANTKHNGLVVPVIKLAKAINVTLPDSLQLSGYHLESLAIDAFKAYRGDRTPSQMLMHFFQHASEAVLRPIVDSSGQSIHVDEYLGPANSGLRKQASHLLTRLARRMDIANASGSLAQWEALFEI
jgi:hypothetical protein